MYFRLKVFIKVFNDFKLNETTIESHTCQTEWYSYLKTNVYIIFVLKNSKHKYSLYPNQRL